MTAFGRSKFTLSLPLIFSDITLYMHHRQSHQDQEILNIVLCCFTLLVGYNILILLVEPIHQMTDLCLSRQRLGRRNRAAFLI